VCDGEVIQSRGECGRPTDGYVTMESSHNRRDRRSRTPPLAAAAVVCIYLVAEVG